MYISTSHHIGDIVYYYSAGIDSVSRAEVVQITYTKTENREEVLYCIRLHGSDDLRQVSEGDLYTRPDSAFYRNPLPVPEPEAVST